MFQWYAEQFAYLINKLDRRKEGDGIDARQHA